MPLTHRYMNCHHRQIFDDIKESLNDFLYGKADERLKDDYKKAKNQSKKEKQNFTDFIEKLKGYDDPIIEEDAEY